MTIIKEKGNQIKYNQEVKKGSHLNIRHLFHGQFSRMAAKDKMSNVEMRPLGEDSSVMVDFGYSFD